MHDSLGLEPCPFFCGNACGQNMLSVDKDYCAEVAVLPWNHRKEVSHD